MYKIIDIHTHTYPEAIADKATVSLGNFYNFEIKGKGTYDDLEKQAAEDGVCGFFLLSVATNAHQVTPVKRTLGNVALKGETADTRLRNRPYHVRHRLSGNAAR